MFSIPGNKWMLMYYWHFSKNPCLQFEINPEVNNCTLYIGNVTNQNFIILLTTEI